MSRLPLLNFLRRSFGSHRPSSPTSLPGYLIYDTIDELVAVRKGAGAGGKKNVQPMDDGVKALIGSDTRIPSRLLPPLSSFTTHYELQMMMKYYENQDRKLALDAIKTASSPRQQPLFKALLKSAIQSNRMSLSEEDDDAHLVELSPGDLVDLTPSRSLADHVECANVLKKRRARMRRHKHKKRLRKNRYKNKK